MQMSKTYFQKIMYFSSKTNISKSFWSKQLQIKLPTTTQIKYHTQCWWKSSRNK